MGDPINITQREMALLLKKRPERDTICWDTKLRRFGIRLSPSGAISFLIQYRNRQGRSRRHTIGSYPGWTATLAREEAER